MACNKTCDKCSHCEEWCSCQKKKVTQECESQTSSKCIIYKPYGGLSGLDRFLGISTNTNLQDILERLDDRLYNVTSIQVPDCGKALLGVSTVSEISFVINKIVNLLCTLNDTKVKVNVDDSTTGYLYEKLTVGECLTPNVVTNSDGFKTLQFSINFDCVKEKINDVTWQDSVPTETICNGSTLYKKQISNENQIRWTIIEENHSSCTQCSPSWVDVTPKETDTIKTGEYSLDILKKQQDGCGNFRWVEDSLFTWNGSTVDCSGVSSSAVLQVTPNIPTEFAISGGNTLNWVTNGTNTYTFTGLPKNGSLRTFKARPVGSTDSIGGILQMCVDNDGCTDQTWTNTDTTRCENNVSEIQQVSNCGSFRWVAGGNKCQECNDSFPIISISSNDVSLCGNEQATLTASHNGCDTITWYKRVSGGNDVVLGTGSPIIVSGVNATVYAKCANCQGTVDSTNDLEITYTSVCDQNCNDPVFSLTHTPSTCNTNTWLPNADGYVNITGLLSGDKFAVYPNTDGTGSIASYEQAANASNNVLVKGGIGTSQTVRVRVYNGSNNCFSEKQVVITAPDCLANCVAVTDATITNNNATPVAGETVAYSVTPNGSAPYTYQWKIDNVDVNGETSSVFNKNWLAGDTGNKVVSVEITNCNGTNTHTESQSVTVNPSVTNLTIANNC